MLIDHLSLASSQRMRADITVPHSDRILNLIFCSTEKMWPAEFQVESLEEFPSLPTMFSPLKPPPENFMCLTIYASTKYKYYIRAYYCVSYDFQNKENIFHCFTVHLISLNHFLFQPMHNIYPFKRIKFLH
jgi:hypothetical protein